MTDRICHVCRANADEVTPRYGVARNADPSTTYAWFRGLLDAQAFVRYCAPAHVVLDLVLGIEADPT